MSPRIKKLIGLAILLPALFIYFIAAAALGERVPDHQLLKALYFIAAGVAWALPVIYLLRWAEREKPPANPSETHTPPRTPGQD